MTTEKYPLKFHEALKAAVEDGVEIEAEDSKGAMRFRDGGIEYISSLGAWIGLTEPHFNTLLKTKWRIIPKPLKAEFNGTWYSHDNIIAVCGSGVKPKLEPFLDKKCRITIEEISE